MRSKHSFLDFMGESSDKQAEVKITFFWFHIQRHLITNRRCWQPPLIPDSPTLPPTGFPPKQHPAAEPEEDDEEEESPHPGQLDHHPGAAGSRLEVARREENLQPSALCDHSVTWRQRRRRGETDNRTDRHHKTWNSWKLSRRRKQTKQSDVTGAAGVRCPFHSQLVLVPDWILIRTLVRVSLRYLTSDLCGPHEMISRWRLNLKAAGWISVKMKVSTWHFWVSSRDFCDQVIRSSTDSDDLPGKDFEFTVKCGGFTFIRHVGEVRVHVLCNSDGSIVKSFSHSLYSELGWV